MQQISSSQILTMVVHGSDTNGTSGLSPSSSTLNPPNSQPAHEEGKGFHQVFKALGLDENTIQSTELSLEEWQRFIAENPELSQQIDLSIQSLPVLENVTVQGQSLSLLGATVGDLLPPGDHIVKQTPLALSMPESKNGEILNQGSLLQGVSDTEGDALSLLSLDLSQEPVQTLVQSPALQAPQLEDDSSFVAGFGFRQDDIVAQNLLTPLMAEIDPVTKLQEVLKEPIAPILPKNLLSSKENSVLLKSNGNILAGSPLAESGIVDMAPTTQKAISGLFNKEMPEEFRQVSNLVSQTESISRFKSQFAVLSRESSAFAELTDSPATDRTDASNGLSNDIRSRIQGAGLRQYATGIGAHVDNPEWGEQMSQKIVWLSGRNIQSAEIQLNPAELGPVEVRISVQNDQATVSFNAQHASVREMMDSNGVDLSDVNVSSGNQENPHAKGQNDTFDDAKGQNAGNKQGDQNPDHESELEQQVVSVSSPNIVDFYA